MWEPCDGGFRNTNPESPLSFFSKRAIQYETGLIETAFKFRLGRRADLFFREHELFLREHAISFGVDFDGTMTLKAPIKYLKDIGGFLRKIDPTFPEMI